MSGAHELYTCDVVTCEVAVPGRCQPTCATSVRCFRPWSTCRPPPTLPAGAANSRRRRHKEGKKLGLGDALIAAVAADLGATVVTRNRPDFERQGIEVLTY